MNVMKSPNCAAAPSRNVRGAAISGPKSVSAPTPRKISGGNISSFTPWETKSYSPPSTRSTFIVRRSAASSGCAASPALSCNVPSILKVPVWYTPLGSVSAVMTPRVGRFASRAPNAMGTSRSGSKPLATAR